MRDNPIIVALDVDSAAEARRLVAALGPEPDFYKVGMELYAAAGMEFVRELIGGGKRVFLDLKFYDIPETVKRAVSVVAQTGVTFLTVHAMPAVMRAAVEGRGDSALRILGVTVLTSFDDDDLREMGYAQPAAELVAMRARQARAAGVDGIVCSPAEVERVRQIAGPELVLVTPGVRSEGVAAGDQKRVATPAAALASGANYVVVGRQLSRATNPRAAWEHLRAEVSRKTDRSLT